MRAHPILIVEDDPDTRDMVRVFLESNGCAVATAPDGMAALETVAQTRPSLILLDLAMPRMDGQTFAHLLRNTPDPEIARTPIVLMSAVPNLLAVSREIGAAAVLQKPVDLDALLDMARPHCDSQDERDLVPSLRTVRDS